jgi:hypothetical protein
VIRPTRWGAEVAGPSRKEVEQRRDEVEEAVRGELEDKGEQEDAMQRQALEEVLEKMEHEIAARKFVCEQVRRKLNMLKRKWE